MSHKKWQNILAEMDNLEKDGSWYGGTEERLFNVIDEKLTKNIQKLCDGQCNLTMEATEAQ
jgi:hypothetical protein